MENLLSMGPLPPTVGRPSHWLSVSNENGRPQEQIVAVLKQAQLGVLVAELIPISKLHRLPFAWWRLKTGLPLSGAEKSAVRLTSIGEGSILRSRVSRPDSRGIQANFAILGTKPEKLLCRSDCVAERGGFEPPVQVLARTTV
jgi:hypothetical protein